MSHADRDRLLASGIAIEGNAMELFMHLLSDRHPHRTGDLLPTPHRYGRMGQGTPLRGLPLSLAGGFGGGFVRGLD